MNLRQPRNLRLSRPLSAEEISRAWSYLADLPDPEVWADPPPPPQDLQDLSDADWHLLGNLLAREELLKAQSEVH